MLRPRWGTGFWQTVNGDEQGHFLVVGINNMSHLLYLKEARALGDRNRRDPFQSQHLTLKNITSFWGLITIF